MSAPEPIHAQRLYVIRHSDTDWTDAHRHTGSTDIALNERGDAHARLLAQRLRGLAFAQVYTSPLLRVRQTCSLAGFDSHAMELPDLTEWNMGDDEGRTTAEIRAQRPNWEMFRDGPNQGESLAQVFTRADRFVTLAQEPAVDSAVFASGQIIRCIAARWLGLPPLAAKCFSVDTCSVGILTFEHNRREPVVALWNDTGHLPATGGSIWSGT
ncbi:MAG: histidine phosphatase family protein [Planctomycetota bacterium]|nr:histidine phosphatase family protein [Planctomycetota bacterium]